MYAANVGTFLQRDPLPSDGASILYSHDYVMNQMHREQTRPEQINLYTYNNPTNMTDPSGEFPWLAVHIAAHLGVLALWYGHYCGPGSTLPGPGPKDGLDACCLAHDNCYVLNNADWWNALPRCGTPATRRCDADFCNCARQFNCGNLPLLSRPHCYTYQAEIIAYFC